MSRLDLTAEETHISDAQRLFFPPSKKDSRLYLKGQREEKTIHKHFIFLFNFLVRLGNPFQRLNANTDVWPKDIAIAMIPNKDKNSNECSEWGETFNISPGKPI